MPSNRKHKGSQGEATCCKAKGSKRKLNKEKVSNWGEGAKESKGKQRDVQESKWEERKPRKSKALQSKRKQREAKADPKAKAKTMA